MSTTEKGRDGEAMAVSFLEKDGWKVLTRNYRASGGEIDVIAAKDKTIVFAEVKFWDAYGIVEVERMINREKIRRIIRASKAYLYSHRLFDGMRYGTTWYLFEILVGISNISPTHLRRQTHHDSSC